MSNMFLVEVYVEVASELAGRRQEELRLHIKDTTVTRNSAAKKDIPK
jgi:hypothetical protein